MLGEAGADGAAAGVMTDSLTGDIPSLEGFSRRSTAEIRLSATASAIEAALTGEESVTTMLRRTVEPSTLASTLLARAEGLISKPKESITGCRTTGVLAVTTYEATLAWLKVFPC
ncbi:hypothetical protein GCM10009712_41090 [Pseudarthrobacter sulfonivorans]